MLILLKEESFENNLTGVSSVYKTSRDWEGKNSARSAIYQGIMLKLKGWRLSQSEAITRRQRPDLWKKYLEKKNEKH